MRKIYLLIALTFVCNALKAQSAFKKLKYGVKGGVNLATVALTGSYATQNIKDGVSNVSSFYFGGYAELFITKKISVQSGLSISGKGSKSDIDVNFLNIIPINYKRKTNIMYLEIPVNAVFYYNNFYVGAGPYAAYGVVGKEIINAEPLPPPNGNVKFGENPGEITPFDYGANFLLGYQLKNGFNLGANYGLGLGKTNILTGYDIKASNRVLSILVGFCF